ncbi:MAG: cellulase N-terminal Ig-like domain-containing protein [Bacteroidota bacterium]
MYPSRLSVGTFLAFALCILLSPHSSAQSSPTSLHIKVDQFGYLPGAKKIAVISDPQQGYNAAESFSPAATYEVHKASDESVVLSLSTVAWNGGNTHAQSGDKVWWADFSSLETPGEYYL